MTYGKHEFYRDDLLLTLGKFRTNNPHVHPDKERDAFWRSLDKDDLRLVFDNWYNRNRDSVSTEKFEAKREVRKVTAKVVSTIAAAAVEDTKAKFLATLWLTKLPDGTTLREATGADAAKLGKWGELIAKFVKPAELVSKALTDTHLYNLWKQAGGE